MKQESKGLPQRIKAGDIQRKDVARRLAELAYGKPNDCVRLVLEAEPDLGRLDLTLLSEVRRTDKGTVEIRLIDRLQVLEQLAALMEKEANGVDAFFQSLQGGEPV